MTDRSKLLASPPHPRGSTLVERRVTGDAEVSPAPAGIDPTFPRASEGAASLPRTRGTVYMGCILDSFPFLQFGTGRMGCGVQSVMGRT